MCDGHPESAHPPARRTSQQASQETSQLTSRPSRRDLLRRAAGLTSGALVAGVGFALSPGRRTWAEAPLPVPVASGLSIRPRAAWGEDLPPTGPLRPEDARFLLVHHTASPSNYPDARDVIRGVYRFHTGPDKGWPDVCYEFFVGRDGDVWEGRAGALDGPVVADATGGSQGFAQLVCLLGDFSASAPTAAARDALVRLLAWLALRDGIDVSAGATTTFTSRGSDRWKAGTSVTTPTIAGHRDMTYTACPGNGVYGLLPSLRSDVAALVAAAVAPGTPGPDGLRPARRLGRIVEP